MSENQNSEQGQGGEQWTAFQKIWSDTFNKMLQLGVTFSPESTPPEFMRQMRTSIFQAMAQSWDEFLRSPQFLDGMKQWMESAIAFRKMTNDYLTRAHHEGQTPASQDIDALLVAVRHLDQRLNDRVEELSAKIDKLNIKPSPRTDGNGPRASRPKIKTANAKAGNVAGKARLRRRSTP